MQSVISAPPGSGKSLHCVEILEDTVRKNPNRMVFTNIVGIDMQGVLPIKSSSNEPFDWRNLPSGSLIVYDEAHEHPAFSKVDLLKNYTLPDYVNNLFDDEVSKVLNYSALSEFDKIQLLDKHRFVYTDVPSSLKVKEQEEIIKSIRNLQKLTLDKKKEDILDIGRSLLMHRHWGYDIIFVTQKPDLLNSFVKAATSQHLILRRLFKLPLAIIYTYAEVQDQFGNATRKNALSWRLWFFPKRLFKYYISAESHPTKNEVPFLLKAVVLSVIALIGFAFYYTKTSSADLFGASSVNVSAAQQVQENSKSDYQNETEKKINAENKDKPSSDLIDLCRMAVNVDTPQCKKFFDDLTASGGSIYSNDFQYDPSKPFDVSYKPTDLKPKDFPRFKNAIVYKGKCTALSQQGTIMHDVSKADCFRLANGDRPFDYFYDGERNVKTTTSSISDSQPKENIQIDQKPSEVAERVSTSDDQV